MIFTRKRIATAILAGCTGLTVVPVAHAYDAAWNGYREDITRHSTTTEDNDCPNGNCLAEPNCNNTKSPVYVAKGFLVYTEADIEFPSSNVIGLNRTYNSFDRRAGLFGRGWVTKQEMSIARTYKAITEANPDGSPKAASDYQSVPILLTEYGRRYRLEETATGCTTPEVLFFTFEKLPDGGFKQVYEDSDDYVIYSDTGRILESYSDSEGLSAYYEYDDQERLISQYDSYGYRLDFSYNEQGFVAEAIDQSERSWKYYYNANGTLAQTVDPEGNTKDYGYKTVDHIGHKQYLLESIVDNQASDTDPRLSVTWNRQTLYNLKGYRVSSYTEEDGRKHTYTYSQSSYSGVSTVKVVKKSYAVNNSTATETQTFHANKDTYLVLYSGNNSQGTTETKSYNSAGQVSQIIDRRGNKTLYEYNTAGRITQLTELAGSADEKVTSYTYWNDTDRIASINRYGLQEEQYTYDLDLRVTNKTEIDLVTGEQRVWNYTYHANFTDSQGNQVLGKLAQIDGPLAGVTDTYSFTYNTQGLPVSITNPLNQQASFTYNASGQLESQTDINGIVTQFTFDSRNRLTRLERSGRIERYSYNAQDQLTSATDPLERTITL
ncbi:MAG: DUF6531 domain-containing protein, partial [Neptuniibacter sp.]